MLGDVGIARHVRGRRRCELGRYDERDRLFGRFLRDGDRAVAQEDLPGALVELLSRGRGGQDPTVARLRRRNDRPRPQDQRQAGLRSDPDVQTMEDALGLSFLEHELDAFSAKHTDEKLLEIRSSTSRNDVNAAGARPMSTVTLDSAF